ncbi:hypothetical protein BX616_002801 [Lobosporangium transversale]|uniref:FAD-binding domain-containing protein n=1 Tax=Lobosporangium transversale TaxID=64571 RepID=A0A1Y2H034_9FUNG|nr:hypothetical protein BCR41DRAFT_383569 [Lobosporangium transversale]KAF9899878.1 hypothetical protein BX616_002801 [Lobosporangium transversale]ORZ27886.1 hypothetical protein BCR41DRAFT_383569 [Lobosporangium transversale]|eukprot:XP_021885589.1 hypothetical protein BCR41DRAFT_383569 [Lobosporangium transversale]
MASPASPLSPPKVLIVGAGVAGLLLGALLERAKIPYVIFERAATVKPLGAIMSVNASILPVFEQIGIYDDLMKFSYTTDGMYIYDENLNLIRHNSNEGVKEAIGYGPLVFSRPKFYDLLLAQIPTDKIHFNKKVVSIEHGEEIEKNPFGSHVKIVCADNTSYEGDILVGADGTYSAVRQSLYKDLREKNLLPKNDMQALKIGYLTMVGTTDPLDVNTYPELKDDFSHFHFVIGNGKPHTWHTFTVPENKMCWGVQVQLTKDAGSEDKSARDEAEWGPQGTEAMIKEVRDFTTPYGPLGKIIDATPRERISKVYLEEKLFDTWHYGRTVLIGDAAHKMSPSQGQGAVNALEDAVILANCLYDIAETPTYQNITEAFKEYKEQRFPHVKFHFQDSAMKARLVFGQTWSDQLLRKIFVGYMPQYVRLNEIIKAGTYKPQCLFLPLAPKRGTKDPLPQKPLKRKLL